MIRRTIGIVSLLGALASLGSTAHGATQDVLGIGSTSLSFSSTSIDFFSVGGANAVDLGTSTGAFVAAGTTATMQNLVAGGGAISNFITIPALPQAQFTLTSIGPGVANTSCTGLVSGGSCSPFAGSPFILTMTSAGTAVSFSGAGTVKDSAGATTAFGATFGTEVVGQTPAAVQTNILGGGTVSSPFSASIKVPSGTFAGTLNVGLSSTSLTVTTIGFSSSNVIGPASTGAFSSLSGTTATLKNLSAGSGAIPNFLSVAALPQVLFVLTGVGPGVANTSCTGLAIGGSCSPFAGSPFILVDTMQGTSLFFTGAGLAQDSSTNTQTTFEALFSTEFAGETAQDLATTLLNSAELNGPLSVEFLAGPFESSTAAPLPATLPLFATGIGALGLLGWRRKRKVRAV